MNSRNINIFQALWLDMHLRREKLFMNDKNKTLCKKINQWVEVTDEDLKFAKHGFTISSGVSYRIIAFHSQQCAEKYLKAFLVYHKIDFPYTHNITTLIDLCSEIDETLEELRDAEILTSYATANRYPSEYRKLKKSDAQNSVKLAEKVKLKIRSKLLALGFKLLKE
jgi:HEPN domain-containing protein